MLYIFGGLPGTGKSTLAIALAHRCEACYVRIDTVEQVMRDAGLAVVGPAGYVVGYGLALDNLRLGRNVVADSVNPLSVTRQAWVDVAIQAPTPFAEIEIICSDAGEHRHRVESRQSDIPSLKLPSWEEVLQREYQVWSTDPIVIDTAQQTPAQSLSRLLDELAERCIKISGPAHNRKRPTM